MSENLWMQIRSMFECNNRTVKFFEGLNEQGVDEVSRINASPESALGSIIVNSNGIVVDDWISILGQSSDQRAGVTDFNTRIGFDFGKMMVVAVDIVGGVFAINLGRFDTDYGMVWYFAPDTVRWESMEVRYSEFVAWAAQGDIAGFYQSFRWTGWKKDVESIDGFNYGVLIYPYLWSKECNIETAAKKKVPLKELIGTNLDFEKKFSQ